jgi:hypothetical protein
VDNNEDGSINIQEMIDLCDPFIKRGFPIIPIFNLGTTLKSGIDDVEGAIKLLESKYNEYGTLHKTVTQGKNTH